MSLPCGFMASGVDVNGWVLVSRLYFPGERLNELAWDRNGDFSCSIDSVMEFVLKPLGIACTTPWVNG
ncbi:hypothetical protein GCM10025794_38060 [Massilia kyonggiensis]|jgi:hypothetical protein